MSDVLTVSGEHAGVHLLLTFRNICFHKGLRQHHIAEADCRSHRPGKRTQIDDLLMGIIPLQGGNRFRAAKEDIRVYGLSDYRIRETGKEKPTILLGYANLTEEQIREAVRKSPIRLEASRKQSTKALRNYRGCRKRPNPR